MKRHLSRHVVSATAFLATAALAQAHPGHDGHDFTWDFGHLADHPDATILWAGVLGAVVWCIWKVFAAAPDAPKSAPAQGNDEGRGS